MVYFMGCLYLVMLRIFQYESATESRRYSFGVPKVRVWMEKMENSMRNPLHILIFLTKLA